MPNNLATPNLTAMPSYSSWTARGRSIRPATTRLIRAGRLANQLARAICLADGTATRKFTARKPTTRETTTRNPTHDLLNRYATDEQKLKPTGIHMLNTSLLPPDNQPCATPLPDIPPQNKRSLSSPKLLILTNNFANRPTQLLPDTNKANSLSPNIQ